MAELGQAGQVAVLKSKIGVRTTSGWRTVSADEGEDPAPRSLARRQALWRPDPGAYAI